MRLRTGKHVYKIPRHFDRFEGASIAEDMRRDQIWYTVQPLTFVTMLEMRNANPAARKTRGRPDYVAVEPGMNKLWLYPTPDRPYDFRANLSEIFQI
jgi:hypothetical protein